jgi:hypothetical protein
MDVEETEGRNDCAGESQHQFNLLSGRLEFGLSAWKPVEY